MDDLLRLWGGVMRSIYLETTIISYFTARPSRDLVIAARHEATRELWPKLISEYDSYVSALVREEAGKGDAEQAKLRLEAIEKFPALDADEAADALAMKIICRGSSAPPHGAHPQVRRQLRTDLRRFAAYSARVRLPRRASAAAIIVAGQGISRRAAIGIAAIVT
jgi:hypothetical protein